MASSKPADAAPPPTSVYLDQNVFGHLLDKGDWKTHPIGKLLDENKETVGVWVSPTHVIELSQATDHNRRAKLARLMLELCGAKRMWHGSDFHLIEMFGAFLNSHIPGAFDPIPFFDTYKDDAARMWLGYLGLLAAVEDYQLGPGGETIRRWKRESHLLHCRVAADPMAQIGKLITAAQQLSTTPDPDPMGLGDLTDDELEAEIATHRGAAASVDKKDIRDALSKFQKHRKDVVRVYGAIDIGMALQSVFKLPCDLDLTFNAEALVKGWPSLQSATGVGPLPAVVTSVPPAQLRGDRAALIFILNAAIEAAANVGLAAASIGYYALLRELEVCINNGIVPTDGAALDVDHATAALSYSVFVCRDQKLQSNVSTFLNAFKVAGHEAVFDAKQLKKALGL